MEKRITVLPREVADKIAAGEVIERPASIVKELLENAFDAEADDISIVLEEGGKSSIRIGDNGIGIDPLDVPLAFERHATSKIRSLDDLGSLHSFGFRGEALPSIAAVCDIEVLTRRKGNLSGTRCVVEKGAVREIAEVGCPEGTVILVRNIFETIPVRRKFLKKDAIEQGYCIDTITRLALAHPGVKIKVTSGGRTVLNIPKTGEVSDKMGLVLGLDFKEKMIPVQSRRNGIAVSGFVSKPDFARSSSKGTYFYVNRRYVRDHLIAHAVMSAYRGRMEARKYPAAVLFIEIPPGEVDVNVHPAKTEVRFRDSKAIYEAVLEALAGSLAQITPQTGTPQFTYRMDIPVGSPPIRESPRPYFRSAGFRSSTVPSPEPLPLLRRAGVQKILQGAGLGATQESGREDGEEGGFFSRLRYIGQAAGTYLIFATERGILLIDQHAAHERILFEKLRTAPAHGKDLIQPLLLPEVVSVNAAEGALLSEYLSLMAGIGFDISLLGSDTVVVKSIPSAVRGSDAGRIVREIISELSEFGKTVSLDAAREKILASVACKGAVKAHDRIDEREVMELCRDLDRIPNAASCPHGRPVYIEFPLRDLERMFKRRE